ncbi:ImmA/IrrE family metallo-endopeptidase [Acidisoma sp. S159]|uniref:ImmA/IrrE family metallo-endopeptidase n=1 Tax=Acidisoma sp. S159 TaxID=1747225 RepID=UPI001C2062F7|nr:ImmA/IrrE family metallo-endopeptidase [Acidisoma sp. S159]
MTGTRPRYTRIEQLTDALMVAAGVNTPPVPVDRIVQAQGIAIRATSLGDVSGLVVRKGKEVVIGVNKDHPLTRRRFTIAHELAHALLHHGEEVRYDRDFRVNLRSEASGLGVDIEEIEANFFAARLLMPRRFLEADPEAALVDMEDAQAVGRLAKRYGVSVHAMSIRLGTLAVRRG